MASQPTKTALEHFDASAEIYEAASGGCTREVAEKVVAKHLLPSIVASTGGPSSAVILDNASGPGVATDVLLAQLSEALGTGAALPEVHLADGSAGMLEQARQRFGGRAGVHVVAGSQPGEELAFADGAFTHSITNLGLLFFTDPVAGAKQLYRTLRPGGVAVVTGWEDLGYPAVIQAVQRAVRPDCALFKPPIQEVWFRPGHTEEVLREAGFESVEMSSEIVHWGALEREVVAARVFEPFGLNPFEGWSQEEMEKARAELMRVLDSVAKTYKRSDGREYVGIEMKASVAVCRKK